MGSSWVTSGWWGVVSSLFDLLGDSGFLTSVHVVRACLVRLSRLLKFFPHFVQVYTVVFFILLLLLRRHTDLT